MGYAFISYSTKNQSAADAMRALFNKHDIDTWMAPYDIPAGSEYAEVLYDALSKCSCLVLMLTNVSQNSQWVRKEVNIAITNGKTIIPVKLEDIELNSMMKFYLNDQQIVSVHVIDDNSAEIQSILKSVIGLTEKKEAYSAGQTSTVELKTLTTKIELTVWSPVNTDVYLNNKNHLVMKIDRNLGVDYKHDTINVSGEFNLIFTSKGFEKVVAFEGVDDSIEYHLDAILSKKEINDSYDMEEAIKQIKEKPTAYAFKQLEVVGDFEDIQFLKNELENLSITSRKTKNSKYIIGACANALGKLAIKYNRLEDAQLILKIYEKYDAQSSWGYMMESIVEKIQDEGFLIKHKELESEDVDSANLIEDSSISVGLEGSCVEQNVGNNDDYEHVIDREDISDDETMETEKLLYEDIDSSSLDEKEIESIEEQDKNCAKANKTRGHLVNSYRRVTDISKEECEQPIEISMPDGNHRFFDFCGDFAVSNQKRYIVVRQKNDVGEYLFFIFRNSSLQVKKKIIAQGFLMYNEFTTKHYKGK